MSEALQPATSQHTYEMGRRLPDVVTRFIRDVGFPIAVAAYLLLGLSPKLDEVRDASKAQTAAIERLIVVMEARK